LPFFCLKRFIQNSASAIELTKPNVRNINYSVLSVAISDGNYEGTDIPVLGKNILNLEYSIF